MEKYVGIYRVVCEFDRRMLRPCKEDTYIYCAKGGQIYRFDKDTLIYYRQVINQSNRVVNSLKDMGIEVIKDDSTSKELQLYFNEKDINVVAKFFKARKLGANIKPTSKNNLKLFRWYKNKKSRENCNKRPQIKRFNSQVV
ncbi:hypothetical protein [Clostridium felsineum]|uniref:hypothetical protein n=1 Tax=Clostridium felsineum TaxID=36839 RepID=UPI00098BFA4B|nr:hypothetical protein [Clostridium felsineum]URZ02736.1 hypothetical protein CLAUR_027600 [Clostridium felsineum]